MAGTESNPQFFSETEPGYVAHKDWSITKNLTKSSQNPTIMGTKSKQKATFPVTSTNHSAHSEH